MFVSIYRQRRSSSTSSQRRSYRSMGSLGYKPVKPGDNNNKPAQYSLKVDRHCNVGHFLLNIFFLYYIYAWLCRDPRARHSLVPVLRIGAIPFETLRHTGPGLYCMYVIHTVLTRSRSAQKLYHRHIWAIFDSSVRCLHSNVQDAKIRW